MSGLDKIIGQIEQEAKDAAAAITKKAEQERETILSQAKAQCQEIAAQAAQQAQAARSSALERGDSAAQMQRKTAILSAKQRIISETIDAARDAMCALESDAYFALIEKMAGMFARPQSGEIFFSQKDLARLPAGFAEKLQAIAAQCGGSLTLSQQTRELDGGFVLAYGGIEENCSFEALFASQRDQLQDKVHAMLFAG